jgi:hypothetical protein
MGAVGINENGLTVLHWELGSFDGVLTSKLVPPAMLYKQIFVNLGVGTWLSWGAVILALVSTAGLIPDMIASGAIETTLSKPISRTRLLLSKFVGALIFGALQVCVFCIASFLVIGIRGGSWEWAIFLAVPLVVLVNSYLLCVCFLAGLLTRSTIAALIITLLFWFVVFVANTADGVLLSQRESTQIRVENVDKGLARDKERLATARPEQIETLNQSIARRETRKAEAMAELDKYSKWSRLVLLPKAILPKTSETTELLSRKLRKELRRSDAEGQENIFDDGQDATAIGRPPSFEEQRELNKRVEDAIDKRSLWWVLGTSVLFVVGVLTAACVVFQRRDF